MWTDPYVKALEHVREWQAEGTVDSLRGMLIECKGLEKLLSVGSRCRIIPRGGHQQGIPCEAVGFRAEKALLMPFGPLQGVGPGCRVILDEEGGFVYPDASWLGRVVNAFGEPIDGKGPLPKGDTAYMLHNRPPPAHQRKRVQGKIDLGVRAINTFLTCCRGQRLGIFSGSGVGKSILLSMLARFSQADVNVIGLIGERGREVQEFLEDDLGEEGLKRSVIIVATSDESALMRKQAAYLTLCAAEYFRDQSKDVLMLMDSVTRFAMAQREIGLSAGEPPTTKGYPPTVFAELPRLMERAGPGIDQGSITALFSVLVEGDDTNEPIADSSRGILDGHIILERAIADRGRFPAINMLKSVSRMLPDCNNDAQNALIMRARRLVATYEDMAEMIRLGAYRKGTDPEVDAAIHYYPKIESFLAQRMEEKSDLASGYRQLAEILDVPFEQ